MDKLLRFGRGHYMSYGKGAVLVKFTSEQPMVAHIKDKDLCCAKITFVIAKSEADGFPYQPEEEVFVIIGITDSDNPIIKEFIQARLYCRCANGHKLQFERCMPTLK